MTFGVFIHRSDSIYDDTPAEKYQFPEQYLDRARACLGDWIVYYEPRKVAETKGYYAVAKVERIIPDLSIGVQKGPPIGVQKGPPSSSSVTGMGVAPFALVAA